MPDSHFSNDARDRRINNCPVVVCDHHAERDGYFEIATVINAPILRYSYSNARIKGPARRLNSTRSTRFRFRYLPTGVLCSGLNA